MFEKGLLAGKRILVTGGGSGLGAAMGRRFVELGAELIIAGRRLELLEATAAEMRSELGDKVSTARCDIRDGQSHLLCRPPRPTVTSPAIELRVVVKSQLYEMI